MNYPNNYPPNPYQHPHAPQHPQSANQKPRLPMRERLIFLGISLFFYAVALFTPAVVFKGENPWPGFGALAFGWMAILVGQFGWFANLPLLIGGILLLCRRWIGALVCAILATLFALNSFFLYWQKVPADEAASRYSTLDYLGAGFYLWLLSILALGVSAVILRKRERALVQSPQYPQYPQSPYQQL
jgi:hypothetical protein